MLQYIQYNAGQTGQTIVAIPALGERKEIFERLAQDLEEFCFLAIDLPGHNNSPKLKDFSIEKYIEEIKNLLDCLSIPEAHFIGNSIGAWIIQSYYKTYADSVLSLTLLDGGYYYPGDYEDIENGEIDLPVIEELDDLQIAIKQQVDSMEKLPFPNKEIFGSYLLHNFIQKEGVYVHHSNAKAVTNLSNAIVETNYCIQQTSELPILLLLADQEKDESEEKKVSNFLQSNDHAIVELVYGSYHLLPLTNPNEVSKHFKLSFSLK